MNDRSRDDRQYVFTLDLLALITLGWLHFCNLFPGDIIQKGGSPANESSGITYRCGGDLITGNKLNSTVYLVIAISINRSRTRLAFHLIQGK